VIKRVRCVEADCSKEKVCEDEVTGFFMTQ